jgi:integrase
MADRDGIRKRGKKFQISYTGADGKRHQEMTDALTYAAALKIRAVRMAKADELRAKGYSTPGQDTFEQVARRFLQERRLAVRHNSLTPETLTRETGIVTTLLKHFDGGSPIAKLQRLVIKAFVDKRKFKVSPYTLRKELGVLKAIIGYALDAEIISADPCERIKTPELPRARKLRYTPEQFRLVLAQCPDWFKPIVILANATGMRRGSVLSITPAMVDLQARRVSLPETKNGEALDVFLGDVALATLRYLLARHMGGAQNRIFAGRTPNNVSVAFKRAARRAGLEGYRFHDTRHTAGVYMRKSTDFDTVAATLGHLDPKQSAKYQEVPVEEKLAAAKAMDRHLLEAGVTVTDGGIEVQDRGIVATNDHPTIQ